MPSYGPETLNILASLGVKLALQELLCSGQFNISLQDSKRIRGWLSAFCLGHFPATQCSLADGCIHVPYSQQNCLLIPGGEASRALAVLDCGWGCSRSHRAAWLCLHQRGDEDQGFRKKKIFSHSALHLLHSSLFGLNFLGSVCMFVLYKQDSCIRGIFACSGLFFFPVQSFSPSFSKSFKGSIDVRVCLLTYCMYMTEHLYNFWTFTCSLIL